MELIKQLFSDSEDGKLLFSNSDALFSVANSDKGITTLAGYALKWNDLSSRKGGFKVRLAPNSANFMVPTLALMNHDPNQILARNDEGDLRLTPDATGVKAEIDMDMSVSYAKDAVINVNKRKIKGMSFAMLLKGAEYSESKENGEDILTFSKFNVDEVTITPVPSFANTSIEVKPSQIQLSKNKEEYLDQYLKLRELEIWLNASK